MESSLRKRGKISSKDIIKYENFDYESLKELQKSDESFKRTIAINLLGILYYQEYEDEISTLFIEYLKNEKSLYTRIEVQKMLQKGGKVTIKKLCKEINEIPNNQHIDLPKKITKKKTYPIARDLPIRVLSKMGILALEELKKIVDKGDREVIKEVMDGIGYLLYHDKNLEIEDDYLLKLFIKYQNDDLILWKIITCMSGTSSIKIRDFLNEIILDGEVLEDERLRTICFIEKNIVKNN